MAETAKLKQEQEQQDVAALSIALQHPLVASDQQNICRLMQACKSWKAAVQQSAAGTTSVCLTLMPHAVKDVSTLGNMAAWLPKHASLVGSIRINKVSYVNWPELEKYVEGAEPLVLSSLKAAGADRPAEGQADGQAAPGSADRAGAQPSPAAAAAPAPVASPTFMLRSYSSNLLHSPDIVASLPGSFLTQLVLDFSEHTPCWTYYEDSTIYAAMAAALARLTNLRDLKMGAYGCTFRRSIVASISSLTRLTKLHLHAVASASDLRQLPASLEILNTRLQDTIRRRDSGSSYWSGSDSESADDERWGWDPPTQINLVHLTRLRQLRLRTNDRMKAGATLPMQLIELNINSWTRMPAVAAFNVTVLQQLQRLTIWDSTEGPEQLQQLMALSQLPHLELQYEGPPAITTALAWQFLPQLRTLVFNCGGGAWRPSGVLQRTEFLQLLQLVGKATSLTKLWAFFCVDARVGQGEEEAVQQPVAWHGGEGAHNLEPLAFFELLKRLTGLQELNLTLFGSIDSNSTVDMVAQDALHLSTLTSLTMLHLKGIGAAVETTVAAALARALTQLQSSNVW